MNANYNVRFFVILFAPTGNALELFGLFMNAF